MKNLLGLLLFVFALGVVGCEDDSCSCPTDYGTDEQLSIEMEACIYDKMIETIDFSDYYWYSDWYNILGETSLWDRAKEHSKRVAENLRKNTIYEKKYYPDNNGWEERADSILSGIAYKFLNNKYHNPDGSFVNTLWWFAASNVDIGNPEETLWELEDHIAFDRLMAMTIAVAIVKKQEKGTWNEDYDDWDIVITYIFILEK
jgi:hypothetical protein